MHSCIYGSVEVTFVQPVEDVQCEGQLLGGEERKQREREGIRRWRRSFHLCSLLQISPLLLESSAVVASYTQQ